MAASDAECLGQISLVMTNGRAEVWASLRMVAAKLTKIESDALLHWCLQIGSVANSTDAIQCQIEGTARCEATWHKVGKFGHHNMFSAEIEFVGA